jgi:hypothetical protein
METFEDRKLLHERTVMDEFQAEVEVVISFKTRVKGSFNPNYKTAQEVAEKEAIDKIYDQIPIAWFKESEPVVDSFCKEFEITGQAPEVDDDH